MDAVELIDDPEIDAVFNPLPNGLHFEWSMKAIAAGKHVLLEKPSCNNAQEISHLMAFARERNVVVLEAFHSRFHPAAHRLRELVHSGELGKLRGIEGTLTVPRLWFADDDIRYDYALGGGCMMDMGVYPLAFIRWLAGVEPKVVSAQATPAPRDARVDSATTVLFSLPDDISASLTVDFARPSLLGLVPEIPRADLRVVCERGSIVFNNFVSPHFYHYLEVTDAMGRARTEKVYRPRHDSTWKGEDWWSTYRYQLEAFVDRIRGREPVHWVESDDSIAQMQVVDKVYDMSGLGPRPSSQYLVVSKP